MKKFQGRNSKSRAGHFKEGALMGDVYAGRESWPHGQGGLGQGGLGPNEYRDVREALKAAREWKKKALFLQSGLNLKVALANFGWRLRPAGGRMENGAEARAAQTEERRAFREWYTAERKLAILRLVKETWEDWFGCDNAVLFWRVDSTTGEVTQNKWGAERVLTLRPEDCEYSDEGGVEKMRVCFGWKRQNLSPAEGLGRTGGDRKLVDRYSKGGFIQLSEAEGEFFRVLKRERTGWGFAWPRVMALFKGLEAGDGLETANVLWAHISRSVIRHFKKGHEIKNGPKAGNRDHFYRKEDGERLKALFEGKLGQIDWASNFDVSVEYPFPSLDRFDKKQFEGVFQRIALWLGPVGAFLFPAASIKGMEEVMMRFMRAEMANEREEVGLHLGQVINRVFAPPMPVEVKWSDKIFMDSRQLMEFLKFLVQTGALSQRTALESVDEEAGAQREQKQEEGDLARNEETKSQVLPLYDKDHGKQPGLRTGNEGAGRPAGQKSQG